MCENKMWRMWNILDGNNVAKTSTTLFNGGLELALVPAFSVPIPTALVLVTVATIVVVVVAAPTGPLAAIVSTSKAPRLQGDLANSVLGSNPLSTLSQHPPSTMRMRLEEEMEEFGSFLEASDKDESQKSMRM